MRPPSAVYSAVLASLSYIRRRARLAPWPYGSVAVLGGQCVNLTCRAAVLSALRACTVKSGRIFHERFSWSLYRAHWRPKLRLVSYVQRHCPDRVCACRFATVEAWRTNYRVVPATSISSVAVYSSRSVVCVSACINKITFDLYICRATWWFAWTICRSDL